ncbi:uncharacterized protein YegJ (DUF2314 family) [Filimonas zeae]|uniref:DUF2314 domain-containing protein n=1 Tax=Filimonas zeae TaxID=1737353 RepID=A0A917J1M1_9BACT|nr:DUF2314 domain-containing protein [Filimonas zeae]MDR6340944.1 uncharacterized protein YegJ (DUF2314 family) [Filimonas zeae]GGH77846.1 hypothetical protein GCM10011379_44810 [Filimonas zeae]
MTDKKIYYAKGDAPEMIAAFEKARNTFKYFWRELNWESRRIVPALDLACVKIAFVQENGTDEPAVEHMWINDVYFDGDYVSGTLINDPDILTNISNGDAVRVSLDQVSDWLFASMDKTYGGFTIHQLRSNMTDEEREEHDEAWGLDFGDFNQIEVVRDQYTQPENLIEHPMSINMQKSFTEFLQQYPQEITIADENGYTLLHKETIAGNKTSVEILLQNQADTSLKTHGGKTALDFARQLNWEHLIPVLEKK